MGCTGLRPFARMGSQSVAAKEQAGLAGLGGWCHGPGCAIAGQTRRCPQSPRWVAQRLAIEPSGGLLAELIGASGMMIDGCAC